LLQNYFGHLRAKDSSKIKRQCATLDSKNAFAARAQQPAKLRTIGFLGSTTPSAQSLWTAAFLQRLRELNWVEGRNVAIEYRWAEGHAERFAEIAAEYVRLKVDVIVTVGTEPVIAAKKATTVSDCVRGGRESVRRGPGRKPRATGRQCHRPVKPAADLAAKRLELLGELLPGFRTSVSCSMWTVRLVCCRAVRP
jgi:putative tryptophan/tyrosine transport system substrate-binding protein